jgi:hypothetical protein
MIPIRPGCVPATGFQHALDNMTRCLERHGYNVTKRRPVRGRSQ